MKEEDEISGLPKINKVEIYEDNVLVSENRKDPEKDNKKIYYTDEKQRFIN